MKHETQHLQELALGFVSQPNLRYFILIFLSVNQGIDTESGTVVPLFNPRYQKWKEHFAWSAEGTKIMGITACGRATVISLRLNNNLAITVRQNWVKAGWHPPN